MCTVHAESIGAGRFLNLLKPLQNNGDNISSMNLIKQKHYLDAGLLYVYLGSARTVADATTRAELGFPSS